MASSELTSAIKTLNDLHSKSYDENNAVQLSDLFDKCLKMQLLIENSSVSSSDKIYQDAVSICVRCLEKCTTMVNDLELFSSNETIDEVQTSSLKYLILPAFLGSLNLNLQSKELADRLNFVRISEIYFKDYLLRCKNYELSERVLKYFDGQLEGEESSQQSDGDAIRQKKIQLFKLKKEIEDKEKRLKIALERPELEENIREYYLVLLERWAIIAIEELENIKREKDILKMMPNKEDSLKSSIKESYNEVKPLKPIIITKNEIQKKVFGLGYPSIPVMSIEDFYQQKFHKQIQKQKSPSTGLSLQDKALKGEPLTKEEEEIENELLMDKEDPVAIMKARHWDEWKDDNPRGSGNRYNKG